MDTALSHLTRASSAADTLWCASSSGYLTPLTADNATASQAPSEQEEQVDVMEDDDCTLWSPTPSSIAAFEEQFLRGLGANRSPGATHSVVQCVKTKTTEPDAPHRASITNDGVLLFCTCADCLLRDGAEQRMYRGAWQPAPLDGTGVVEAAVELITFPTYAATQPDVFQHKVERIEKLYMYQQGPAPGHVEVVAHELNFQGCGTAQNLVATSLTQSTIGAVVARGVDDPSRPAAARALLREAKRLYDSGLTHGHIDADNALEVVAEDGTIAVAFIGFELAACENPDLEEPTRNPDDQRAIAALFGDVVGVREVRTPNPWLRHIMWQLGNGDGYNGLMLLEPGDLRSALAVLHKKLSGDAAARGRTGCTATLLIDAEKALRVLLSTIPRGSVPSELYHPTCGNKNARLLVTVEKALAFMGRRFKTGGCGIQLGFPPLVDDAGYVRRAIASWQATLNRKHPGAQLDHDIKQYPADASDGDGLLLFCDCRHCCDSGRLCPGIWTPSPDAPAVEVTVSLVHVRERNSRARRLFERDVQKLTSLYEAAGTSLRVVQHAFDVELGSDFFANRWHFVATTAGLGTLTETLRGPLNDTARLQLARAVLQGANLLVKHNLPHGSITPDVMVLEMVDGTPRVAFLKLPLPSINNFHCSENDERWATIMPLSAHERDQWSTGMVLYEIMESSGLSTGAPQLPCFYQRLGASSDLYDVQCQWQTPPDSSRDATYRYLSEVVEVPIPPGTDPWLRNMMRRLLAGVPYNGLLSLEPAELRGTVAELAGCLDMPTVTALQPLLDVCDAGTSTYDQVLATLRRTEAGALTAVDEALSNARVHE